MSKKSSLVLSCILSVIIAFFAIVAFLPDNIALGKYNLYHSPVSLLQTGNDLGEVTVGTYKVTELADGQTASASNIASVIRKRLASVYNYYGAKVTVDGDEVKVTIPSTRDESKVTADSILANVTKTAKIELLKSSTYSEADVVPFEQKHFASISCVNYLSGENAYYIINIKLTKEGKEIARKNLTATTSNWSAYVALDGAIDNASGVAYSSNTLQVYTSTKEYQAVLASYFKTGALDGKLTETESSYVVEGSGKGATVAFFVFLALLIASWVFFIVCYKKLGVMGVLSTAFASAVFAFVAGPVYFNLYNVFAFIGSVLGLALIDFLTYRVLENARRGIEEGKEANASVRGAFASTWKENLFFNACALVLGVILWVIPTGVTAPLGNALVYCAVLSFATTAGLNRLFGNMLTPIEK